MEKQRKKANGGKGEKDRWWNRGGLKMEKGREGEMCL